MNDAESGESRRRRLRKYCLHCNPYSYLLSGQNWPDLRMWQPRTFCCLRWKRESCRPVGRQDSHQHDRHKPGNSCQLINKLARLKKKKTFVVLSSVWYICQTIFKQIDSMGRAHALRYFLDSNQWKIKSLPLFFEPKVNSCEQADLILDETYLVSTESRGYIQVIQTT